VVDFSITTLGVICHLQTFGILSARRMHPLVRVEEIEGPYGRFAIGERAIQRLWAAHEVRGPLLTLTGTPIEVLSPGDWNRSGGPDFLGAELKIDGQRRRGDVEIHLRWDDWNAHGHQRNPNFNGVILHAVLLPGAKPIQTAQQQEPETIILLPYLPRDLEDLAEEDALLDLRGRAGDVARRVLHLEPNIAQGLRRRAIQRFEAKAQHAQTRINTRGWEQACHELCLEALGLGGNRAPMSELAQTYKPSEMILLGTDKLYLEKTGRWRLRGLRPAGHPHRRLSQYLELLRRRPQWHEAVRTWSETPAEIALNEHRRALIDQILAQVIPDGRTDTLCINALLPLTHHPQNSQLEKWLNWPPGNFPEDLHEARLRLGLVGASRNWEIQGILDILRRTAGQVVPPPA